MNKTDFKTHDLAIQVLKDPLPYSSKIRPICLPDPGEEFYGRSVMTAGWGRESSERKRQSSVLKAVELKVSKKRYNHTKLIGTELSKNKEGQYKDPCQGDSGTRNFNSVVRNGGAESFHITKNGCYWYFEMG